MNKLEAAEHAVQEVMHFLLNEFFNPEKAYKQALKAADLIAELKEEVEQ